MRALKIIGIILTLFIAIAGGLLAWLVLRKPNQRPPSAEKVEPTPTRLARGRYLAHHVADCINCHSDHLDDRFGWPVKPGTEGQGGFVFDKNSGGVPGVVAAQNLTPDPETGKGQWTDGELIRAIREGVNRHGEALFPMMPYEGFRRMSDEDVKSVVAYLRTLKPIRNAVPARKIDFPVNLFIKFVPSPVEGPIQAPSASDGLAYGKYMVTLGGCADCHTARDDKGQKVAGRELAGGWAMTGPWGTVVTTNLTPHPSTFVGQATKEEFIARFKAFEGMNAENAPVAAPGKNTVMPWLSYAGMTEADLGAIYDYLKSVPPLETQKT